ncbi:MAG: carboxy terminal-processing peptidase [Myxococcales bacterium]|nr:carboxy terminal-processing peptidase [Myxococcales bacterium]
MIFPRLVPGLALALALPAFAAAPEAPRADSPLICWTLPSLMNRYLENHVTHRAPGDELDRRIVDLFAERVDGSKSLLTQAQYDELTRRLGQMVEDVRRGNCEQFDWLKKQQRGWHAEMEAFARKLLSDPALQVDPTLELVVDAEDRPRPKTEAERDALRTKLLHFQLANYVRGGTALEEAKKRLIHRYELVTRRVAEQTDADLYTDFLNAFANALDPHSTYFSADMLEDFRISMDLSLEGIGAVLQSRDGYTTIQEIVPGGAADRQGGLKTKDKIIAVSQGEKGEPVDVIDMALRDVVRLIRGKKGTKVKLTVLRQGEKTESHDFVIVRDKIDLKEQAAKLRWEEVDREGKKLNLAVIDLPSFYGGGREAGGRDAVRDLRKLLKQARDKKADGVLLDLSRNGGGLLQGAVDIAGLFLREGPMVGIDGPATPSQILEDTDDDVQWAGPLVVLTSRGSASASEIVAGALKDYHRGLIVGDTQTFGKGSVQNIVNLPAGFGALKVTTAMFFRPGGDSTQSRGVPADIVLPSIFDHKEIGEESQPYALPPRSIKPFRGDAVQGEDAATRWQPITDALVAALAARSKARVAAAPAFAEIRDKIKKREANEGKPMKIAELLDEAGDDEDAEEAATKAAEDAAKKDELTPQALEALQILADLSTGIDGATAARAPIERKQP